MSQYPGIEITPSSTSYFSEHEGGLDPDLFAGDKMHPKIRQELLAMIHGHLSRHFRGAEKWSRAWVAGSGVSYQWSAARFPGDLDCLIGVDYLTFRRMNPGWERVSDVEISQAINETFYEELTPTTTNWLGLWEVTFFCNPDSWDIRAINPYAAYSLTDDEWTVRPSREGAPKNPYWDAAASRDLEQARVIVSRYEAATIELQNAKNPAYRVNAEKRLQDAIAQASALFSDIHEGRKAAFSRTGDGYHGYGNYRWQSGKASGVIAAMRSLHDYQSDVEKSGQVQTYGLELPDTSTLIRRAAARRAQF